MEREGKGQFGAYRVTVWSVRGRVIWCIQGNGVEREGKGKFGAYRVTVWSVRERGNLVHTG